MTRRGATDARPRGPVPRPGLATLAVETTGPACSAAVIDAQGRLVWRAEAMARGHAEALVPMVAAVMAEAGLPFDALGRVAVTRGPGSFTGARVGLAAARGLALAAGAETLAVSTLALLALAAADVMPDDGRAILAAIDARRNSVYWQRFDRGPQGLVAAGPAEEAAPGRVLTHLTDTRVAAHAVGSGAAALIATAPEHLTAGPDVTADAATLARLAAAGRLADHADTPRPLYLRPPDAKRPGRALLA
ncbi:tRNA threonylcarbamoyladenosine biosynthesis protein TsaB [Rhodothalassium salexigens DSM 2132]|uniref:tRNA threonylcarbamoyladenosine biosynthesis protein TsaB n=1 Tax=Rhodothalassium salexigens DSM 2132 TaxID=1188247 RepID=A0A4R2PKY7_RHOSA|nr:tRNA threonylcarbamoyladenosine biosynthesis protein TsaB [Rhodothalassium salexigens DSM 2132]